MRIPIVSLTAAGAAAAAAAFLALPGVTAANDEAPRWQQARAVGEAESCIPLRSIRNTRVRDDRTIDFYMNGRRIYRNTLPQDCGGLGFDRAFSYRTSLSQLCSTDIITVLPQPITNSIPGPSCGLGEFTPIELPDRG